MTVVEEFLSYFKDLNVRVYADDVKAGDTLLVFNVQDDEYGVIILVDISAISYANTAAQSASLNMAIRDKLLLLDIDDSQLQTVFLQTITASHPAPSGYEEAESLYTSLVEASITLGRK